MPEFDPPPPSAKRQDLAGSENPLTPSNIKQKPKNQTAVAITGGLNPDDIPRITAAGRGKFAEQILQLAFENGVKVREDAALAEMLTAVELDSPIPSEAFMAVAEILSYVYRANGTPDPFNAMLADLPKNLEQSDTGADKGDR